MFLPFFVVHGSFYQDHTSRNYFTGTHEQERGNQADTRLSKSLMDVSYKIKAVLWTIFPLSLSVTLWNLGRGTKRKMKEGSGLCFAGLELFKMKITLTKSLLKEPPRYHLTCSKTNITDFWRPSDLILSSAFNIILQQSKSKWATRIEKSWQVQAGMCNREICWLENTFSHWEQYNIMYFQDVKIEILAAECQMQFCKNRLKWNEVFL